MKKLIVTICCALCMAVCALGQQAIIHENAVRPPMTKSYIEGIKKLKEACSTHKTKMSWFTVAFDDNSYAHVLPVEGTASLQTNLFADLEAKIGADAFASLVAPIQEAIDSRMESISIAMPDLSYLDPLPGERYRMILYVIPLEGKEAEMEKVFAEWKKTYESKKATENFHIYRMTSGPEAGYLISISAKNPADMEAKRAKNYQLVGADVIASLWDKQVALTKKYYWKRGYFVPELGYDYSEAAN
ncbi:MAG: hypothetical protein WD824_22070 [Cyclobacteriaceae bacterium]